MPRPPAPAPIADPREPSPTGKDLPINSLWGGRFAAGPAAIMAEINVSIGFDQRLAQEDISASQAHAQMLLQQGILSPLDGNAIQEGLKRIAGEIANGQFIFRPEFEDIHMNIEARLRELIGPAAGRLHTARSRNDQVATDFRLWVRGAIDRLDVALSNLQKILLREAQQHVHTIMPGFTHLQPAQPVTFAHHLLAYVEMLRRDRSRLKDARARLNECPLGAGALAGTPFPIDRHATSRALSFDRPMANSLDAVSDRDFALEYLSCLSLLGMHLSRLAEEIILWTTPQFGFLRLSDHFSTGSSIMPQKRNADAAELIRGKAGRIFGALMHLLTVMKALPLAYAKDMQEDKEAVFMADDTIGLCVAAMAGMVETWQVLPGAMQAGLKAGFITATDFADWLVRTQGLPFRDAHHLTGQAVAMAEARGVHLEELDLASLQSLHPGINATLYEVLTIEASVASRTSYGGTAPQRVEEAIAAAWSALDADK
jgi:argininosuccinate lyase